MSSFDSFKASFKGDIVTQADAEYEKAIARWAANAVRRAKIVAFVKDEADVAAAIKYARAEKLPIAVKGGGHSASGTSSQTDGLVIDLSRHLSGARVDAEKKLAYVGGGAIWETVDKEAIKYGLASVGGTVNHTGVGGLTLGGGYGWLSAKYGLVIDNLEQVKIVVADGRTVIASKTENEDLFWAVRGGGGNFGVVTEFVLQLHEQRKTVYAGMLLYPGHLVEDLFKVAQAWWDKGPSENEGMLLLTTRGPPPDRLPSCGAVVFYNGSAEEGKAAYKAFYDLNPLDLTGEIPFEQLNTQQNAMVYHGQGVYLRGVLQESVRPEKAKEILDAVAKVSETESDGTAYRTSLAFELFPQGKINSVASITDMAFNGRIRRINALTIATWDENTPEKEKLGRSKVDVLSNLLIGYEPDGLASTRAYGNYTHGIDTEGGASKYFAENYPRLQKVKGKFDPENIFNKWFAITPA